MFYSQVENSSEIMSFIFNVPASALCIRLGSWSLFAVRVQTQAAP